MTVAGELLLDTPAARPCHHPRAKHQHGTYGAYKSDRCRCRPCSEANSAYWRNRSRQIAYGRWCAYADAEEAREHVRRLMTKGLGWRTVASRALVSASTVERLLYGQPSKGIPPSVRIRTSTERKLLAVQAGRRRMPQPPDLLTTEAAQ